MPVALLASALFLAALAVGAKRYARDIATVRRTVERRARLYRGANLFRSVERQIVFEARLSHVLAVMFACTSVGLAIVAVVLILS